MSASLNHGVRGGSAKDRAAFCFGDWSVDPATKSIAREADRVQLEPRAMDVLVALCDRANSVVNADELLLQCWGTDVYGDNPVHKTIARLRSVLGDNVKAPIYIETIRKRGYRTLAPVVFPIHGDAADVRSAWLDKSPFPGLQAFDEEHASVFFGREQALSALHRAVAAQMRSGRDLTVVLGPSGSGKTSLVRAGLLPRLLHARGHESGLTVPSAAAFDLAEIGDQSLVAALGSVMLDWQLGESPVFEGESGMSLGERLGRDAPSVLAQLQTACRGVSDAGTARFALFVDRFETLFVLPHLGQAQRAEFVGLLDALARSGSAVVVLACRNDFYPQLAVHPQLMEEKASGGHFDLNPPTAAEIAQMIRRPASAARLRFGVDAATGARLDDLLCASAADQPDALPLLQYTLQELYRLRTDEGELGFDVYHRLGGVEGAIGHRAEEVLLSLEPAQQASLPRLLSLVVNLSGNEDAVTSRRAPLSALRTPAERSLLAALVETRLFASQLVDGEPGFSVAHEALLRRWPRATAWIGEHREALRTRGRVSQLAVRWESEGRPADLLVPRGKQLEEAQRLVEGGVFALSGAEQALIRVSGQKARRREWVRVGTMLAIVCLSLLAAGLGISSVGARRVAQERRVQAEGLMGFMLGDFADKLRPIGRLDLLDSVSAKSLEYLSDSSGDELDAVSLTQRAKALQTIAEVRYARGDPHAAMEALDAAKPILERQSAIDPRNREVLKNLGANAFWQGQIRLDKSDWVEAERFFRLYQDYSDRMVSLDPSEVDGWVEQSYAHTNLGTVALKRGDAQRAIAQFQSSIELKTRALAAKSGDRELSAQLANTLSWLGSALETQGRLADALQIYDKELQLAMGLHLAAPTESLWAAHAASALQHREGVHIALGDDQKALADIEAAEGMLIPIIAREPKYRAWQAELTAMQNDKLYIEGNHGDWGRSLPTFLILAKRQADLAARDSQDSEASRFEAVIGRNVAISLQKLRRFDEAKAVIGESLLRFQALHDKNHADMQTTGDLAKTLVIAAEVEGASGNTKGVLTRCVQARNLYSDADRHTHDYRVLDPWVRSRLCPGQWNTEAAEAQSALAAIGYRETSYVNYILFHQPHHN